MPSSPSRVFKTAWFAKASKKARITDDELCLAIQQVMVGQADDLGGGVFKKRLAKNLYRSLILARGRGIGFTHIFLQRRIEPTSTKTNSLPSGRWPVYTRARPTLKWRKRFA